VPDAGSGVGTTLATDSFAANLVSDTAAGMTFKIPTSVFRGALAEGEYVVAKLVRDTLSGAGSVVFSVATGADSEKQQLPLHPGNWEIVLPIIVTWEAI
jgi:hypothetical protein